MLLLLFTALAAVAVSWQGRRVVRRRHIEAGSVEQLATVLRWDLSATTVAAAGGAIAALAMS